jgi:hypothetical protein
MKYMTKEWYDTVQTINFHYPLKISKTTEFFSKSTFEKLYQKEEKAWLQGQKEMASVKLEDVFPKEFCMIQTLGTPVTSEELEKVKNKYSETRAQMLLENEKNPYVFNLEKEKKNFKKNLQSKVKYLKEKLPEYILQKVADIRVLALDYTTAEVKKDITRFCKANEKSSRDTVKAYWREYEQKFKDSEPAFAREFDFHDYRVMSCRQKGKDLFLGFDGVTGGDINISGIIFKDYTIIKKDKPIRGAYWLYDEIYKRGDGYEIHILLWAKKPLELTIYVMNVEFIY